MTNTKLLENTAKYRKTKKGVVTNIYHKLINRNSVDFDLHYLHEYSKCKKFDRLFNEWVKNCYDKQFKPSIDRINYKKPYTKDNIQWLTWAENRYKQRMEVNLIRARSVGMFLGDNLIKEFNSVTDAVNKTGVSQGNISSCLSGKRKTAFGYIWKYTDKRERSHAIKNVKASCINCGIEFIPQNKSIKYCSRKCGAIGNKNAKKPEIYSPTPNY